MEKQYRTVRAFQFTNSAGTRKTHPALTTVEVNGGAAVNLYVIRDGYGFHALAADSDFEEIPANHYRVNIDTGNGWEAIAKFATHMDATDYKNYWNKKRNTVARLAHVQTVEGEL
jgi:hypothetical protein